METKSIAIIGAGPAGLSAAHALVENGFTPTIYEASPVVGGLSRTERRGEYLFDLGGHRFFTTIPEVSQLWRAALSSEDVVRHIRRSRIATPRGFVDYPIAFPDVLRDLGCREALLSAASLFRARIKPAGSDHSLEGWARRQYGDRLYEWLTAPYTRKVWGTEPSRIPAEWAGQRIRSISLRNAAHDLRHWATRNGENGPAFWYPRLGPGMLWQSIADQANAGGAVMQLQSRIEEVRHARGRADRMLTRSVATGVAQEVPVTNLISSMPLTDLVSAFRPQPPADVLAAASDLRHRCLIVVGMVLDVRLDLEDMWIYIPEPSLRVGRVQHYPSWSPSLGPSHVSTVGMEDFVWPDDPLWSASDDTIAKLARTEFASLHFGQMADAAEIHVFRVPHAYPVYDTHRLRNLATIRAWLAETVVNVQPVGRNGLHRYDNQDHASMTGLLAARNLLGESHDLWQINAKPDYHEDGTVIAPW